MKRSVQCLLSIVLLPFVVSCGTESDPPAKATATSTSSANHRDDIEVLDAVLVKNDDGSATLSARIVNHADEPTRSQRVYLRKDPTSWPHPLLPDPHKASSRQAGGDHQAANPTREGPCRECSQRLAPIPVPL